MKSYWIYILGSSKNGTLYIGITGDLIRRVSQHKAGTFQGFTSKYAVTRLLYYEETNEVTIAIKREKQLKHWNRNWKIQLIEKLNPGWRDLAADWQ